MKYNYIALIGDLDPNEDENEDVEFQISAVDFRDAAKQAIARAEELGGQVIALEQSIQKGP